MTDNNINCPNCGHEIPVEEVLTHQIRESLKLEIEKGVKSREENLEGKIRLINEKEKLIDQEVENRLKKKSADVEKTIKEKLQTESELEMTTLKDELKEKSSKLQDAQKTELNLLKKTRELEEREQALTLEVERKLNTERDIIRQAALKQFSDENDLKTKEKDKLISDLKKNLEDAKRRVEQGSMERQGEIQELDLEETLRNTFRHDTIEPVPKGIRGADVIQTVKDDVLKSCGKIIWESKRTKTWSQGWIEKLKDDQITIGAEIAIIITEAMPPDIENFGQVDQIWVTTRPFATTLATVLRESLIKLNYARSSAEGMTEKMNILYQYIIGPEFRQKIEAIVSTFEGMTSQLEKEKRAMNKLWKEREKQIERVTINTSGMYGDFKGLIGSALSDINAFELGPSDDIPQIGSGDNK